MILVEFSLTAHFFNRQFPSSELSKGGNLVLIAVPIIKIYIIIIFSTVNEVFHRTGANNYMYFSLGLSEKQALKP